MLPVPEKVLLLKKNVGDIFNFRGNVVRVRAIGRELSFLPGGLGVYETHLEYVRKGVATQRELMEFQKAG